MVSRISRAFSALAVLVSSAPALAGSVAVSNASFEAPAVGGGLGKAASWTALNDADPNDVVNPYEYDGGNRLYVGANPTTDPADGGAGYTTVYGTHGIDGEQFAYMFNRAPGAGLEQALSATLQPGSAYTLTASVGERNGNIGGAFSGSEIVLLAGSTAIASYRDDAGPTYGVFRDESAVLADSDAYASLVGQPLSIELLTTVPLVNVRQSTDWDNVRLTVEPVAVAEPGAAALLATGLGLLGLAMFAAGRRRAGRRLDGAAP